MKNLILFLILSPSSVFAANDPISALTISTPTHVTYLCKNNEGAVAISIEDKKAWSLDPEDFSLGYEMNIVDLRPARCRDTYGLQLEMSNHEISGGRVMMLASIAGCGAEVNQIKFNIQSGARPDVYVCEKLAQH